MSRLKERNSAIELLRIICMVMIVAGHFTYHGGFQLAPPPAITLNHGFLRLMEMGGGLGADVFVMISGYFLVNSKVQKPKKVLLMWLQGFTYGAGIYLLLVKLDRAEFLEDYFKWQLRPVANATWWFLTIYIVLYILHPYINLALKAADRKMHLNMILVMGVLWGVLPYIVRREYAGNELAWFLLLYCIGAYIRLYGDSVKLSAGALLGIAGLCHLLCLAWVLVADYIGIFNEAFTGISMYYVGTRELPTLITACFMFAGFTKLRIKHSKLINLIASATFGVYLIHDHPLVRAYIWGRDGFNNAAYQFATNLIPHALGSVAAVYLVCTAVELIRANTIERLCSFLWDKGAAAAAKLKK